MAGKYKFKAVLATSAIISLSACATHADSEKYMGFNCQDLRAMSEAQRPIDPFAANRVGPENTSGLSGDREGLKTEDSNRAQERDDDFRAMRAAYQRKGC